MAKRRIVRKLIIVTVTVAWTGFVAVSPVLPEPRAASDASSGPHPLGLTPVGADLAWTLLLAVGRAHAFAGLATVVAVGIALPLGLVSGIRPSGLLPRLELWVSRLLDSVGVFVLVAAAMAIVPGLSLVWVAALLGMILWTALAGVVRHAIIEERGLAHYEAAVVAGLPIARLVTRHLLPAAWRRLAPQALGVAALLVGALGAVDFVGLGIKREVSLGTLLYDSLSRLTTAPHYFVWTLAANVVVVAMFAVAKDMLSAVRSEDWLGRATGPSG